MATDALGDERPTLFLRKATGLVRGWSVRDSLIYACLSTNIVTLGLVEFAYQDAFATGELLTAVLISGVWVSFLVVAYSGLVVTIPRAGGDYVWQSRILGSGLGFVMAATGWWFILWLWAPIYGSGALRGVLPAAVGGIPRPVGCGLVRDAHGHVRRHADHDRPGRHPGLARHGRLRQGAEVVLLRRPARLRHHRDRHAGQSAGADFISVVQQRDRQAVRHEERVRGHHRGRRPRPIGYTPPRFGFSGDLRAVHAAGPDADVLPALAELGHHALRRDPRGVRLQAGVQRDVLRPVDHGAAVGDLARAVRQDLRLRLLPGRQRELGGLRRHQRTRCRSSPTRRCWSGGW